MRRDFSQLYPQYLPEKPSKTEVCAYEHCYGHVTFSEYFELKKEPNDSYFHIFLPFYLISNLKLKINLVMQPPS